MQSGLLDIYGNVCRHPLNEISKGLEEDHPLGIMQDCFMTVALQYIFLAGPKIYQELVEMPVEGSEAKALGRGKWNRWMEKLKEVADRGGKKSELGRAARGAHDKMMTLLHGPTVVEAGESSYVGAMLLLIGFTVMWILFRSFISPSPRVTWLPRGD